MRIRLINRKTIEFVDGLDEINSNDVLWHNLYVELDKPLTVTEILFVKFEKEDGSAAAHEILLQKEDNKDTYFTVIPKSITALSGAWTLQILTRKQSTIDASKYIQLGSDPATFYVSAGLSADYEGIDLDGVTADTIVSLYEQAKNIIENTKGIKSIEKGEERSENGYTITPIQITTSDDVLHVFEARAKNGEDGTDGVDGVSVTEIVRQSDVIKNGYTETNLLIKLSNGKSLPFYVRAKNGSSGADGSIADYTIALSLDKETYIMTLDLKDGDGNVVSSDSVDFPLESVVVNGKEENGVLTLTLNNGNTIDIVISDLVEGLVSQTTFDEEIAKVNEEITAAKELYWCTYGTTTVAEIAAAISSNLLPVCKCDGFIYVLHRQDHAERYYFTTVALDSQAVYQLEVSVSGGKTVWLNSFIEYEIAPELPTVSTSDNGKFLRVVDGAWVAESVESAESTSF